MPDVKCCFSVIPQFTPLLGVLGLQLGGERKKRKTLFSEVALQASKAAQQSSQKASSLQHRSHEGGLLIHLSG